MKIRTPGYATAIAEVNYLKEGDAASIRRLVKRNARRATRRAGKALLKEAING